MRCSCGCLLGLGLCVMGHDAAPVVRTKTHTVKRSTLEVQSNPFRRGRPVKGKRWSVDYRIGERKAGT